MMKFLCKSCLLVFCLLFVSELFAQKLHTIKGSADAKSEVNIIHRRGPLNVRTASDGKVSWEVNMRFEANDDEEAQKLISAYQLNVNESGNSLELNTNLNIERYHINNGRSKITLKDGTVIRGIKKLKVELTVYVPTVEVLGVKNRYEPLSVDAKVNKTLNIDAYQCKLDIREVNAMVQIQSKYSKGLVGNFKDGKLDLYECNIDFGNVGDLDLKAKYSKLTFGNMSSLESDTYECNINALDINGDVEAVDKYSRLELKSFGNGKFNFYETDLRSQNAADIQAASKYSELVFQNQLKSLHFSSSYEDVVESNSVEKIRADESKYTDYKLAKLGRSFEVNAYEGKIEILQLTDQLEKLAVNGKYAKLFCQLPKGLAYQMEMDSKYTKINLAEGELEYSKFIQKSSDLKFIGKTKNATDNSTKLEFKCYDCKLQIH